MRPKRKMPGGLTLGVVRRNRWLGALGLLAFVAGAVVLPLSHLVQHRNDHEHGVAGVLRQAFALLREHGPGHGHDQRRARAFRDDGAYPHGHEHEHEHGHRHDPEEHSGRAQHGHEAIGRQPQGAADDHARRPTPKHGHGSLEHLDVALLSAGVFVLPPSFAAVGRTPLPGASAELLAPRRWDPKQPRAPPA